MGDVPPCVRRHLEALLSGARGGGGLMAEQEREPRLIAFTSLRDLRRGLRCLLYPKTLRNPLSAHGAFISLSGFCATFSPFCQGH